MTGLIDDSYYRYAFASVGILLTWLVYSTILRKQHPPLFPGPKGLPFIGNAHQLGKNQWIQYTEWHRKFGPVYSLNFAGQPVIVVGTAKAAADLLERRSAIYSDRPRFIMATEILTGGMNLAFARYGDRWKRMRRAAHDGLSIKAAENYTPLQEKEAIHLLHGLLHEKGRIDPQLRRTAAATVLSVVYSYPPIQTNDPLVTKVEHYVDRMLKAALPGNYFVDIFPWMMHIPTALARWKREGYAWFKKDTDMFLGLAKDVKAGLDDGSRSDCFMARLLDPSKDYDLNKVEKAWLAGMMFGAGAEAIGATLSFFMLAMVLYPRVQEKLRAEVEAATDSERFPTFNDVKNLPYLTAVIKETLRWRPMGPLAVPHSLIQDDIYDGHFIPAGTLIFPNVWAIHHDENVYPNPDEFRPERYLEADGVTPISFPNTKDHGHLTYGLGRRSCIGYTVANNALKLNAASVVFAFNINPVINAQGKKVSPDPNDLLDEGLAVRPMPFDCSITPRSKRRAEMIEAAFSQFN
ncbi:hypothetical protein GALMADRAFT_276748 [Galerina marginata CBS 339.88]|uniref:Cytochrome P450 n=1 Tax=Galerina marginata (strain CBS 339.88) TaxID=685588 RepID=A0A067TIL1_GALM3|nr:hypothetical protein GALMADRAFT_276748 [Galerina marginata CBS 339.88]